MIDFYLLGVAISFLIGSAKIAVAVATVFSQRAKNLEKIGIYYSFMRGAFGSETPTSFYKLAAFVFYLSVIAPLFSWLSVASAAWAFIAYLSSRSAVPEKVKELQYKIAHADLSKEQLISLQEEAAKALDLSGGKHTEDSKVDSHESLNSFVLNLDGEYQKVRAEPKLKTLTFFDCNPENYWIFNSVFEYRFNGNNLECRLIEEHSTHGDREDWSVEDNVVLESEIRKRYSETSFKVRSLEEELEHYRSQVVWHAFNRYDVRFFVMGKHPELFPPSELRRVIRSDLERLRLGKDLILQSASEHGIEIIESETGYEFSLPERITDKRQAQLWEAFSNDALSMFSVKASELDSFHTYENDLLRLLDENA